MTPTPFVLIALTLLQCFGTVTLGPATKPSAQASSPGDIIVRAVDPYAGLPTKFGDEDDVIHLKQAPHLVVPPMAKASTQKVERRRPPQYDPEDDEDDDEMYDENDDEYAVDETEQSKEGDVEEDEYSSSKQSGTGDAQLGPSLDGFGASLDGGGGAGDEAPMFLSEPQSAFIVRGRAAVLKCKAAHAIQLTFKCSGSSLPPPSTLDTHVDPHSGVHVHEVTAVISKDLVYEYFGKGPFKCECLAWSPRGTVKSQPAIIEVAYLKKQFSLQPQSLHVELGARVEIRCGLPSGMPLPTLQWLKNGAPLQEQSTHHHHQQQQMQLATDSSLFAGSPSLSSTSAMVTSDGNVLINRATLNDMANYTCVAENVSGKRMSEPALVTVVVNGGWSAWGPWTECRCPGRSPVGQKRTRNCVSPSPLNGGAPCAGPATQKTSDCVQCTDDIQIVNSESYELFKGGRWSVWSEWGTCTSECIQIRRRSCIGVVSADSTTLTQAGSKWSTSIDGGAHLLADKSACSGRDIQTAECRGGNCSLGNNGFKWTLYVGLTLVGAVCVALGALIARCVRKGSTRPFSSADQNDLKALRFQHANPAAQQQCNITTNYEYPSLHYHSLVPSGAGSMISQKTGRPMSEHHYDVPQMAADNFRPLVGLGSSSSNSYSSSDYSKRTSSPDSVATPVKAYSNGYANGYT